jgi:arylsulfatase A-like enzyme
MVLFYLLDLTEHMKVMKQATSSSLFVLIACLTSTAWSAELPNIVMIMADDLGWSDIAAYRRDQGLSDPIPTPNLDRLCAEGMRFRDAHSPAALCAPTRFSMMTGSNPYRNGQQWGTWGFTAASAFSNGRKHVTVGEIARTAGYRTAFFGKMHFGGGTPDYEITMPNFPTTYGFDYTFCTHGGIQAAPYLYFENDRFVKIDPADPLNPSAPGMNSDLVTWSGGDYTIANGTGTIQGSAEGTGDANWNSSQNAIINSLKAAAFITNHVANHPGQPFMMYYCPPQVHVPHTPPTDFEPNADGTPGTPPNEPVQGVTGGTDVADMTYELDLQVGRILGSLEDPDGDGNTSDSILTNTLVMFTSDNGGLGTDRGLPGFSGDTENSTGPLRGTKGSHYEGGHRVTFVAMWPSRIATNSVSDQIIGGHDWVGVLYALTTNSMAADQAMDCVNILPILLGEQPESEPLREFLILQSKTGESWNKPYIMRQGDYVLLMDQSRVPVEFYNLANDLHQDTNLINEPSEQQRIADMETLFKQHDQKNEPRSTAAYIAPDVYPPLPNPAEFASSPTALGSGAATMSAKTGTDFSGPVEYYFEELSGHEGGSDSGWQLSPTYLDDKLLPGLTYSYTVRMRDALGQTGSVSATFDATPGISSNNVIFMDDFESSMETGDDPAAPYPVGVWHHQGSESWSVDSQSGDTSVNIADLGSDVGLEMRIGYGYDEVVTLYSTAAAIDTNRTYTFSGRWEIDNTLDVPLGFIAGFAEFSAVDGSLVQRLTPDTMVFGNTNAPTIGETGTFNVTLAPAALATAGITSGNRIGVFFHHDDDGTLYSDGSALRNDVYLVDDVALTSDAVAESQFDQWQINYGVFGALLDPDVDKLKNLGEFAFGGDPTDGADLGYRPSVSRGADHLLCVYPRRKNSGVTYWLETSTNLASPTWVAGDYTELPTPGVLNADFEAVTNELPMTDNQLYIRVGVTE